MTPETRNTVPCLAAKTAIVLELCVYRTGWLWQICWRCGSEIPFTISSTERWAALTEAMEKALESNGIDQRYTSQWMYDVLDIVLHHPVYGHLGWFLGWRVFRSKGRHKSKPNNSWKDYWKFRDQRSNCNSPFSQHQTFVEFQITAHK